MGILCGYGILIQTLPMLSKSFLDSDLKIVKKGRAPFPYLKIRFKSMDMPKTRFNGREGTPGAFVKKNHGYPSRDQMFELLAETFKSESTIYLEGS
jgi:hypothetical protein